MYTAKGKAGREQWLERYAPLVKRIAHHMMAKLPASVEVDDIIQAGMIGLLDAVSRYEEAQGAQFETYAVQRIRGAILDELRASDWLPRSARRNMRQIEAAIHALEQRLRRPPTEQEVASHLKLPLAEYQEMLSDARGYQILHYEDFMGSDEEGFPDRRMADAGPQLIDGLIDDEMRAGLVRAIEDLPEREKLMMSLYYEQELNLREIGEILGVSESRVCQLHTQAIARLRARLRDA
jgi:RNA polymerase sigma factor for flagellar operon FliA